MDNPFAPPREDSPSGFCRSLKEGLAELREAARPADYWVAGHRTISVGSSTDKNPLLGTKTLCFPVVRNGQGSPNVWPLRWEDGYEGVTGELKLVLLDERSCGMASHMRYPYIIVDAKSSAFRQKDDKGTFVVFEGAPYNVVACLQTNKEHAVSYHWSPVTRHHDRYFASRSRSAVKEWLKKQQ